MTITLESNGTCIEGAGNCSNDNTCICGSPVTTPISGLVVQYILQVVIVVLNSLVLYVVYTGPKKTYRQPAFKFVANLAVCDILVAVSLFVYSILSDVVHLEATPRTWTTLTSMTSVGFNASVNSLIIIAMDRYVFIAYNQTYHKTVNHKTVKLAFGLVWLAAIIPFMLVVGGEGVCGHCTCQSGMELVCNHAKCSTIIFLAGYTKSYLFGLLVYLVLAWTIMVVFYIALFMEIHYRSVRTSISDSKMSARRMQREFRLARTLLIVMVVFITCWVPLVSLYGIDYAVTNLHLSATLQQIIFFPAILNSVCNPIIYAIRIKRMRRILLPCIYQENKTTAITRGKRRQTASRPISFRTSDVSDSITSQPNENKHTKIIS